MREVRVFPDAAALAAAVAEAFVALATEPLPPVQHGDPIREVALTGGTIADAIHREIAARWPSPPPAGLRFWWGDERFVSSASDDRNELHARRAWLDVVGVRDEQIMAVPATDDAADVAAAAAAYSQTVRGLGTGEFDLVMLGLGPDGHVASLFPGFPQLDATDAIAVSVTDSPKPPPERVSLTFEALNRTRRVWFLVSGETKADAVARALAETGTVHETPARGVHAPEVTWWLDAGAASAL